jgi:transposase
MYPSDLSDQQWAKLEPLLCQRIVGKHAGGRPRRYPLRRVVDAVLYVVRTGCQWRQLPKDFPPWKSVYEEFRRWRRTGLWVRIGRALRKELRQKLGRSEQPTAAIIDSQSVKTALKGDDRGYDAGKKIKGRKRHIAVDTEGLLLAVVIHSAGIQDRVGARALLLQLAALFCTIRTIFADSAYTGTLVEWVRALFGWTLTIVKRTEAHRFVVLPKRWVVERTFAWLGWSRRLSKDYEVRPDTAEAMIHIAAAHLMLRRLA